MGESTRTTLCRVGSNNSARHSQCGVVDTTILVDAEFSKSVDRAISGAERAVARVNISPSAGSVIRLSLRTQSDRGATACHGFRRPYARLSRKWHPRSDSPGSGSARQAFITIALACPKAGPTSVT